MKFLSKMLIIASLVFFSSSLFAQHLKFAHYFSPSDFRGQTAQKFADFLALTSNGKLKVTVYPSDSLVKGRDSFQATSRGTVDLSSVFVGYITGSAGLMKVFTFPFPSKNYTDQTLMRFANDPNVIKILTKHLEKNNIKLLGFINSTGHTTGFFKEPIHSLLDVKGKKIRGVGGYSDLILEELGASIVFMSAAEQFLQLETGGIDAVITTDASYINQALYGVAPYTLNNAVVRGPYALLMNKKKWDRLDSMQKEQVMAAVKQTIQWSNDNVDTENKRLHEALIKQVKKSYELTPNEWEHIKQLQEKEINLFIKENGEEAKKLSDIYSTYQ